MGRIIEHFNEDYPDIKVNPVMLVGSELTTRVQSEVTSGQFVGDVIMTPLTSATGPWIRDQAEWFTPHVPENADELPDENVNQEEGWFAPYSAVFGAAYNTEAVEEGDVPRTWDEFIEPHWDGRISMADPRQPSSSSVTLAGLLGNDIVDNQWFSGLAELSPVPLDGPQVEQSLVSGQSDVAIWPLGYVNGARADGAPLEFIPELGLEVPDVALLLKNAPSPEAARIFLDWTVSETGQAAYSESGYMPQIQGIPMPVGIAEGVDLPVIPAYEEASPLIAKVNETFQRLLN